MDEQMISAVASLVYYVLQVIGDWMLFKKAGKKGWHSIIPILNIYDEYDICWKGSRGIFFMILNVVLEVGLAVQEPPFLIAALIAAVGALLLEAKQSFKLARSFGHGFGFGLFLLIFDRLGRIILGLGKSKYVGKDN